MMKYLHLFLHTLPFIPFMCGVCVILFAWLYPCVVCCAGYIGGFGCRAPRNKIGLFFLSFLGGFWPMVF
jgi:hypothetical protein